VVRWFAPHIVQAASISKRRKSAPSMTELVYPPVIGAVKTFWRVLGLKFDFQGQENLPDNQHGGAVLAMNHISYLDFPRWYCGSSDEAIRALYGEERNLQQ
jgi:1-acyl-sn-glycerol-3-phosphate acyltransferase